MIKNLISVSDASFHFKKIKQVIDPAAQLILKHRGSLLNSQVHEKAKHDFVTAIDRQSQKILLDGLLRHFPSYGVLAEEDGAYKKAERMWIVDPIDGTTNFIHDIPSYCISIGLTENGQTLLGVVYDPYHDELFYASRGQGARLNKKRISVTKTKNMNQAILATGFPFRCKKRFPAYIKSFKQLFYHVGGMRRLGSAALDLCYVACGRYDGYWEIGLQIWDSVAGALIVEESGGKVSDFVGKHTYLETGDTLAGNPHIHRQTLKILKNIPTLRKLKKA